MTNNNESASDYLDKKRTLLEKNRVIQTEIEQDIDKIKSDTLYYGKYALIVGGAFVATYIILGWVFSGDDEEEDNKEKERIIYVSSDGKNESVRPVDPEYLMNPVVKSILSSIATFLISIAKEKLVQFIEELNNRAETENSAPID